MTSPPHFDQRNQSVDTQTNIVHADKVIIQESSSASVLPIPQQIPPPPLDFTGREDDIKELLGQFGQGATITGLRGMGGVGKTALALVFADKRKDRFPDGQLFLNMLGTSKSPLKPEDAMAHVIRSYLGVNALLPDQLNGLSGLYRTVLSGKKVLILLDNAAGREQVEPLLPPKFCALLVTSRKKFALPGLAEKDLDVLPLEDARNLLLEVCGRIGDHAEKLAEICGRLPIALRNAASILRKRPDLRVANYIERLGDAKKRLELVDASFSTSYELLTPELQRLWSLLSVFPADFDLAGAAAVWEMEEMPAEDTMGDLIGWSLVDFLPNAQGEGGRYRLHDLARDFAGSQLDAVYRENARLRHARHFMNVLSNADKLFKQGGESQRLGLDLFDVEWANIQEGLSWAEVCPQRIPEIDNLCCDYPTAGGSILALRRHPQELIGWYKNAIIAAQGLGNTNLIAASLGGMAESLMAIGNYYEAIEYLERALSISREIKDKKWAEAINLAGLGRAYLALRNYLKAIEYFEQALPISRAIGDINAEAANLAGLGRAYQEQSKNRKAIEYFEQALSISRMSGVQNSEAANLAGLGRAYALLGKNQKAIKYFEQALPISREIRDESGEAANLAGLGRAHAALKDNYKAIEYFEQALPISRKIKNRKGEAANLAGLGRAHAALRDNYKAIEYFEQALSISRVIRDRKGDSANLAGLGRAYAALGDNYKAIEHFERALAISKYIEDKKGELEILSFLGNAYADITDIDKAVECYEQALKISREIGDKRWEGGTSNTNRALDQLGQKVKALLS